MKSTDPKVQDSTEFVNDVARNDLRCDPRVRDYIERENPRGMPENWILKYVGRDPVLLALDVIRGYDRCIRVEKKLGWERIWIRVVTAALLGSWALFGWLCKFAFDHLAILEKIR